MQLDIIVVWLVITSMNTRELQLKQRPNVHQPGKEQLKRTVCNRNSVLNTHMFKYHRQADDTSVAQSISLIACVVSQWRTMFPQKGEGVDQFLKCYTSFKKYNIMIILQAHKSHSIYTSQGPIKLCTLGTVNWPNISVFAFWGAFY